ncbi:hypothetical protein [Marinococcus luteus]|uniref:hypothetical protein n=1 Tax=Marinococcus luteus TaxID=1122204 RepID=UPI002ACC8307|nr:hypothetical protein [Marinococcus luteus]MDZ5783130.1 hypothetical protein [Marinococcus luteus]
MNEPLWFLVELVLSLVLLVGGAGVAVPLARRWYVKRNGHERSERYANATHRTVTLWFSMVMVSFLLIMHLERMPGQLFLFVVILPLFLLYIAIGTHLWKQESDNKDNYLYDWWSMGVVMVWLMIVALGYQWWGR